MNCRPGCGACCIAISISSPIPGMPHGKPAGIPCMHLRNDMSCAIHGTAAYPAVCAGLRPEGEMCGNTRNHALAYLSELEELTRPECRNTSEENSNIVN